MPQDFIPYRTAMPRQAAELPAVARRVAEQLGDGAVRNLLAARRPVLLGIGASHAAAALPVALLRAHGVPAHRVEVGELPPGAPTLGDVTVAISQGGRSRETIDALLDVPQSQRAALVNMPGTPLTQVASSVLDLGGREDSKASTVGFTGTLVGLALLAEAWAVAAGHAAPAPAPEWERIGEAVGRFTADPGVAAAVARITDLVDGAASVDVVGGGASLAAAEEGALLLREVCRVPATAVELRQYLHGSSEIAAPTTAHLLIGGERTKALAAQLATAGARVALVSELLPARLTDEGVEHSFAAECERVVLETVAFQLVAGALAERLGLDPDEFVFIGDDTKVEAVPAGDHR
jgi:glucosamine--fructose-6-phosphate aminotransferase (isomerizing)